ncbi:hypothetical protein [Nonomuraea helvata]|uniref:Amidase domain-containing protein n=1 Tax=Nonomuraea helvata TaxID=37484 RepID=A0ABV5SJC3_9ACTN
MDDLARLTAAELLAGYRDGGVSPVEAARAALDAIAAADPAVNAFVLVDPDGTLARRRPRHADALVLRAFGRRETHHIHSGQRFRGGPARTGHPSGLGGASGGRLRHRRDRGPRRHPAAQGRNQQEERSCEFSRLS